MSSSNASNIVYDVIGLGFGPANIAISGAILDKYSLPSSSGVCKYYLCIDAIITFIIQPSSGQCTKNVLFIEKHPVFKWHPGMLLPDTRMQIRFVELTAKMRRSKTQLTDGHLLSFLKDLATLRSPQSPLTFLSYLHSQNRLLPFINRGSFTPSRKEFADYLSWAARYVEEHGINVRYSEEVLSVSEAGDGTIEVASRNVESGETFSHYASKCS